MADDRDNSKIPRASVAVSILDDVDAITLMSMGREGIYALWAWTGLLTMAKTLRNQGKFRGPMSKYARRIGLTPRELDTAIATMNAAAKENGNEPWILEDEGYFIIRSWRRYNNHGGPRPGAGRPCDDQKSSDIQVAQLDYSSRNQASFKLAASDPVSVSDPDPSHPTTPAHHCFSDPIPARAGEAPTPAKAGDGRDARGGQDGRDGIDPEIRRREGVYVLLTGDEIAMGHPWACALADDARITPEVVLTAWNEINHDTAIQPASVLGRNLARRFAIRLPEVNETARQAKGLAAIVNARGKRGGA